MESREIAHQLTIAEIVDKRNKIVSLFEHGVESINKALDLSKEIEANGAYLSGWHNVSAKAFKKDFDRKIWRYLFEISGTSSLMNADQKAELERSMENSVPEICEDTIRATLTAAKEERGNTFVKGLIGVLKGTCSTYKNNKSFLINKKLVFSGLDGWGEYACKMKNRMIDIERMVFIVNNEKPPASTIANEIYRMVGKQEQKDFKYISVRTFKNGNAHLTINCKGTLNKLNNIIADYYDSNSLSKK